MWACRLPARPRHPRATGSQAREQQAREREKVVKSVPVVVRQAIKCGTPSSRVFRFFVFSFFVFSDFLQQFDFDYTAVYDRKI